MVYLKGARRYDGANRVVSSGPVNLPPSGTGVATGTIVSSGNTNQPGSTATTTRYDAAGRVLSQHVVNEVDGTRSYDVSYENPDRPVIADPTKTSDQFGLTAGQIQ
ncbi:hypothetical protein CJO94_07990 [Ralstonia solanacearum]|nr:hypothetical protein CJO94_07990 [Ralstonia solanacearum]